MSGKPRTPTGSSPPSTNSVPQVPLLGPGKVRTPMLYHLQTRLQTQSQSNNPDNQLIRNYFYPTKKLPIISPTYRTITIRQKCHRPGRKYHRKPGTQNHRKPGTQHHRTTAPQGIRNHRKSAPQRIPHHRNRDHGSLIHILRRTSSHAERPRREQAINPPASARKKEPPGRLLRKGDLVEKMCFGAAPLTAIYKAMSADPG